MTDSDRLDHLEQRLRRLEQAHQDRRPDLKPADHGVILSWPGVRLEVYDGSQPGYNWARRLADPGFTESLNQPAVFPFVADLNRADRVRAMTRQIPWMGSHYDPAVVSGDGITSDNWWTRGPNATERWAAELDHVLSYGQPVSWKPWPIPWAMTRSWDPYNKLSADQEFPRGRRGVDIAHGSRYYRSAYFLARSGDPSALWLLENWVQEVVARWGLDTEPNDPRYRPEHLVNRSLQPWWYVSPDGIEQKAGRGLFHSANLLRLFELAGGSVPDLWKRRLAAVVKRACDWSKTGVAHLVPIGSSDPPQVTAKAAGINAVVARSWEAQFVASIMPWLGLDDQYQAYLKYCRPFPPDVQVARHPNLGTGGTGITSFYARACGWLPWYPHLSAREFLAHMMHSSEGGPLSTFYPHPMDWLTPADLQDLPSAIEPSPKEAR
jgi:hypothetical protein